NTNTVHVSLADGGGYQIEHVVTGDTVTDVLKYVSYSPEDMVARGARLLARGHGRARAPLPRAGRARQPHEPGRDAVDAAHVRGRSGRVHVPRTFVIRAALAVGLAIGVGLAAGACVDTNLQLIGAARPS